MPAVRQRFIKRPQGQTRMVWSYTCSRTADWSPLVPGALPRGFKSFAARPWYGNSQKDFYLSPSGRRYDNLRDAWNSVSGSTGSVSVSRNASSVRCLSLNAKARRKRMSQQSPFQNLLKTMLKNNSKFVESCTGVCPGHSVSHSLTHRFQMFCY